MIVIAALGCDAGERAPRAAPAPVPDPQLAQLRTLLAKALEDAGSYLFGDAIPARKEIRALVTASSRAWWEQLTPIENFLLFEVVGLTLSRRAPPDVRIAAFCAGLAEPKVNEEWFGTPAYASNVAGQRLLGSGLPVETCLVKLFDNTAFAGYAWADSETSTDAGDLEWTRGDVAAGLVALRYNEPYDRRADPPTRAKRRRELRTRVAFGPPPPDVSAEVQLRHWMELLVYEDDDTRSARELSARDEVCAIVDRIDRDWWTVITSGMQQFMLFQMCDAFAQRVPIPVRAKSVCSAFHIHGDWWGEPGSRDTDAARFVVALGVEALPCLLAEKNQYDVEYSSPTLAADAKQWHWRRRDLAAGLAAQILGETYDARTHGRDRRIEEIRTRATERMR